MIQIPTHTIEIEVTHQYRSHSQGNFLSKIKMIVGGILEVNEIMKNNKIVYIWVS